MAAIETVLFEKCPLCREGRITIKTRRRLFHSKSVVDPCPICSTLFAARDGDNYQLLFCEPYKLVGKHNCGERILRGCYLGATLPKAEWQKIADGGEFQALNTFLEMSEKFRRGVLPTFPSEGLPVALDKDEVVHYVSFPVYLNEEQPSRGTHSNKGDFILTNKRLMFVGQDTAFSVSLENIYRLEESTPGFLIQEKATFEPKYFFPPPYDPVFAAVLGAVHNLKKRR